MAYTGVGQTVLTYGVEGGSRLMLFRCQTPRIRQTAVMDHSGTDLKCWRHEITTIGYVYGKDTLRVFHQSFSGASDNTAVGGSAATAQKQARWQLAPRQRLIIRTGVADTTSETDGVKLYDVQSAAVVFPTDDPAQIAARSARLKGVDVNDGPVCHDCSIEHVTADNMFKVRVTFVVHILECDDDGGTSNRDTGVLSNRWSCADHLDVNLRATRVYDGMLELISAQFSPHWFRSLVLPTLGKGFRRDHMTFVASADGKKLQWQVVDQAIAVAAPYPARTWSIEHSEGTLPQDGLKSLGSIHVTLTGDNDVDVGQLIMLGLNVMSAKMLLKPLGTAPDKTCMLGDVTITQITGDENIVRVSASVQRVAGDDIKGIGLSPDSLAKKIDIPDLPDFVNVPDPYNAKLSYGARTSERDVPVYKGPEDLIGIFRCFLQSPCTDSHSTQLRTNVLGTDYNPSPLTAPAATAGYVTAATFDTVPDTSYSNDHKTKMYRFYQCESHYKKKTLRAAMPLAISDEGPDNSPKTATKVAKLGASQCRREIRIHSERLGDWPQFPDPESFDGLQTNITTGGGSYGSPDPLAITMSLMSSRIVPGTKTLTSTGETIYRSTLVMRFALSRCPRKSEVLKVGVDVWSNDRVSLTSSVLTGDVHATNDNR